MPDPRRLERVYHTAAATLNLLRSFTRGGFADLQRVQVWNQDFVPAARRGGATRSWRPRSPRAALPGACGVDVDHDPRFHEVSFWTSHEALLLEYEEALTRRDVVTGDWYDCSAHMLWIGERTRDPDGAHVHFCAGVRNPIGVKLGPTVDAGRRGRLAERLNPTTSRAG